MNYSRILIGSSMVLPYNLLWGRHMDDFTINNILPLNQIQQINSLLWWVCSVIIKEEVKMLQKEYQWQTLLSFTCHLFVLTTFCNVIFNWISIQQHSIFLLTCESPWRTEAQTFGFLPTYLLTYWNLLHVQSSIGNWRRKQDDVPIDIQPQ